MEQQAESLAPHGLCWPQEGSVFRPPPHQLPYPIRHKTSYKGGPPSPSPTTIILPNVAQRAGRRGKPNWGKNRNGAGAPSGNTNAQKRGAAAELRTAIRAHVERCRWTCALVTAMVEAHVDSDAHLALLKAAGKLSAQAASSRKNKAKSGAPTEAARTHNQPSYAQTGFGGQPPLLRSVGWWPRTESNGHVPFGTTDFKSNQSTRILLLQKRNSA